MGIEINVLEKVCRLDNYQSASWGLAQLIR